MSDEPHAPGTLGPATLVYFKVAVLLLLSTASRLAAPNGVSRPGSLASAAACAGCLVALVAYAAVEIPAQLGVLGGLLGVAVAGEAVIRSRGRAAHWGRS